jgi:hypothetical protein
MDESLVAIYIENLDGIYFAYRSKTDPYAGQKLIVANIRNDIADELCDATRRYNESQALLYEMYNA